MAGLLLLLSAGTVSGDETGLMAVGVRGGVSVRGESPLGEQMRQDFVGGDMLAMFRLPWGWYSQSGWGVGSRLMTSVGAMESEGVTGFVASVVPLVVFGSRDGRLFARCRTGRCTDQRTPVRETKLGRTVSTCGHARDQRCLV